ncbi:MAG TPA: serine hydrolase [Chthoniobacterales bacterium]|nr:serine hydrolase [Chthoniobacterales bacterium]
MSDDDRTEQLGSAIETIAKEQKTLECAVSVRDYNSDFRFSMKSDRLFHAASTIKVAILLAVMKAVDEGRARLDAPLHVRNRFLSVVDQSPYKLDRESDGYPQLYKSIGRTAKIAELADCMITSSSNLATNLLLDFVGTDEAAKVLRDAGLSGVHLRRGVEDENAYDEGINNEATADGLAELFAAFRGDFLSKNSREHAIHILLQQRFTSMIPAGLPSHATVAHKTGEISTVCHDAGIVYLPEREPYIVAVLTEVDPDSNGRRETVAKISKVIYEAVTGTRTGK